MPSPTHPGQDPSAPNPANNAVAIACHTKWWSGSSMVSQERKKLGLKSQFVYRAGRNALHVVSAPMMLTARNAHERAEGVSVTIPSPSRLFTVPDADARSANTVATGKMSGDPMKVLITSARLPHALGVIRHLGRAGHEVVATDTFKTSPGLHSKFVTKGVVTSEPAFEPEKFFL